MPCSDHLIASSSVNDGTEINTDEIVADSAVLSSANQGVATDSRHTSADTAAINASSVKQQNSSQRVNGKRVHSFRYSVPSPHWYNNWSSR